MWIGVPTSAISSVGVILHIAILIIATIVTTILKVGKKYKVRNYGFVFFFVYCEYLLYITSFLSVIEPVVSPTKDFGRL